MELDSASEPSELNYEQGEPEPIYDSHQREKSTGSGLVLAVPAMVLEPEPRDPGAGVVVSAPGGEYENLVADNQYYEQAGGQFYSCNILTHVSRWSSGNWRVSGCRDRRGTWRRACTPSPR